MEDERKMKKQLLGELKKPRRGVDVAAPAHTGSAGKPHISNETLAKWQRIIDSVARIVGVVGRPLFPLIQLLRDQRDSTFEQIRTSDEFRGHIFDGLGFVEPDALEFINELGVGGKECV